jgi:hypothetical protein
VFAAREIFGQTGVKGNAHAQSWRGDQEAVVVSAPEPQSSTALVKGHAGYEYGVQFPGVYQWRVRCRLQHPEAVANQVCGIVAMNLKPLALGDTRDGPVDVGKEIKEKTQVWLVTEGQVSEDMEGWPISLLISRFACWLVVSLQPYGQSMA